MSRRKEAHAVSEALIEKVALFYYLTDLDESKALSSATRTLKVLNRLKGDNAKTELSSQTEIISYLEKLAKKKAGAIHASSLSFSAGSIVVPEHFDWAPWFEFRKFADDREFRTVVYSSIMNFSDEAIANGMELPIGTVRYRLGHGLKTLGHILEGSVGGAHSSGLPTKNGREGANA